MRRLRAVAAEGEGLNFGEEDRVLGFRLGLRGAGRGEEEGGGEQEGGGPEGGEEMHREFFRVGLRLEI